MAAMVATILALSASLGMAQGNSANAPGQQNKMPVIPVGWIDAYPTTVKSGTHPTVSWGVNPPTQVTEVIEIDGDIVTVKQKACIECRILGNGVTAHWSDGSWQFVPAEALVSFNGGSFERIFYGSNPEVNPDHVVWQLSDVEPNRTIRFGGRYRWNGQWGQLFRAGDGTGNVRTLVHGQSPPVYEVNDEVPTLEDFIEPYLDVNGRVNIGPMDFIVFMELTHTSDQSGHTGYDFQDMVLICTMKVRAKGNNRSGLADGTNPGQGNQMGNNDGTDNPNNAPHSGGSGN